MTIAWTKHNANHWSTKVAGKRLDYWPSKRKWRYDNVTHVGVSGKCVERFIEEQQGAAHCDEEIAAAKDAWWSWQCVDDDLRIYIIHPNHSKGSMSERVIKALRMAAARYKKAA
ncbi:MAG: hypothetical protein AAGH90_10515 [Pseudomonadota bacterium]